MCSRIYCCAYLAMTCAVTKRGIIKKCRLLFKIPLLEYGTRNFEKQQISNSRRAKKTNTMSLPHMDFRYEPTLLAGKGCARKCHVFLTVVVHGCAGNSYILCVEYFLVILCLVRKEKKDRGHLLSVVEGKDLVLQVAVDHVAGTLEVRPDRILVKERVVFRSRYDSRSRSLSRSRSDSRSRTRSRSRGT